MSAFAPGWDAFPQALLDFWTERHLLTLSTTRPDGRPHLVPVGVALDLDERCAWVITSRDSRKARNLREGDGRVAACQVDGRRWSTIEGSAVVLDDPASVARAEERYAVRYKQPRPNPQRVALRITVDRFLHSSTL
ncbi:PPOX class F420-dependent oxidoreductase [Nocardioides iriomotensis]|uniref:PPOX class F420-dependent oxidoreductase n=1 Tax=Nocardioides iriomotensis TaxID=715784 RepID=A0A4Q5J822_9ACTN|nr:PPOX class F420-dependent oxidoreductase [Nocardioides iriomotensis]RYU13871.1 PPOX class F420-dependent oxidoreductase [Nocardioides iriomotensis]